MFALRTVSKYFICQPIQTPGLAVAPILPLLINLIIPELVLSLLLILTFILER